MRYMDLGASQFWELLGVIDQYSKAALRMAKEENVRLSMFVFEPIRRSVREIIISGPEVDVASLCEFLMRDGNIVPVVISEAWATVVEEIPKPGEARPSERHDKFTMIMVQVYFDEGSAAFMHRMSDDPHPDRHSVQSILSGQPNAEGRMVPRKRESFADRIGSEIRVH